MPNLNAEFKTILENLEKNMVIMIIKDRLVKRYELYPKELEPEIKNLKILKQILDDYLKGKEITIKIVVLQEFSNSLMSILEKVI